MKKNFEEYLKSLGTERFRSIIIYHESFRTLENFALSTAEKVGGHYCDLLAYFKENENISIDEFDTEELEALLEKISSGKAILYVDKINFLLDTWSRNEKVSFYGLVEKVWNSFYSGKEAILVFFIQTYDELLQLNIRDSQNKSRIHALSSFMTIE